MNLYTGIIGGCMMCQSDLRLSDLYYRQLSHMIKETFGFTLRISFGYYNEFYRIPELAKKLIKKEPVKLMIFQIRPAVAYARSEFIISDYQGGFILNPLLRKRDNYKRIENILGPENNNFRSIRDQQLFKKLYLVPIKKNCVKLGKIFGLVENTKLSLLSYINSLNAMCSLNNIQLFIIGMMPSIELQRNRLSLEISDFLKNRLTHQHINYIDMFNVFKEGRVIDHFASDKIHLNSLGHQKLANGLFEMFSEQTNLIIKQ